MNAARALRAAMIMHVGAPRRLRFVTRGIVFPARSHGIAIAHSPVIAEMDTLLPNR